MQDDLLRRWQTRTFFAVWITYFSYYLCRLPKKQKGDLTVGTNFIFP